VKLLKTIRLDVSDTFVFERAAEPGEWAVSGGFMFSDADPSNLSGKARSAFRAGLLGVSSFGWSTLAQVVNVEQAEREEAVEQLAGRLLSDLGAPDPTTARKAAEEEIAFVASLCHHDADTLIAVHRSLDDEGNIREAFRTLKPRADRGSFRAFSFMDVEGEDEEPTEKVDLLKLGQEEGK
jgi:hypothetical protein